MSNRHSVKSSIPAGFLPNGMTIPLNESERKIVVEALRELGPDRLRRAVSSFAKHRTKPFLFHVCSNPEERGLNMVAVQLINVTAASAFGFFQNLIKREVHA